MRTRRQARRKDPKVLYASTVEILGLPLHPLIVHATVVIVPLAALGAILVAVSKWARERYGSLVLLAAIAAPILTFVTQQSGQDLARSYSQPSAALERHIALGGQLLIWTIGLTLGAAVLMVGQRLSRQRKPQARIALLVGAVLSVGFGAVSLVQVLRIGHAGATSVWGGR